MLSEALQPQQFVVQSIVWHVVWSGAAESVSTLGVEGFLECSAQ